MDRVGLRTLKVELMADAAETELALADIRERLQIDGPAGRECRTEALLREVHVRRGATVRPVTAVAG